MRAILDNAGVGIIEVDSQFCCITVNDRVCQILGYRREELLGMSVHTLTAPEDRPLSEELNAQLFEGRRDRIDYDKRYLRRDGSPLWVHVTVSPVRDPSGRLLRAIGTIADISERKRSEALLHARLRLSELAQRAGIEELLQAALDEAERLTGSQIGFFHFVDEDQEHLTLQAWSTNTLQQMCKAEGKGQHYPISQAGAWVECFRVRAAVIHNDYASLPNKKGLPEGHAPVTRELVVPILRLGAVVALIGVGNKLADYTQADADLLRDLATPIMDLVARQQAEKELRASEARYRSYLEVTGQVGWTTNADGEVVEDLPAWWRYTGQALEAIQGWGWAQALHPDDVERTLTVWRQAVAGKKSYETEYRLRRHDGVYRHFLARGVPVLNENGSVREWVGTCIDITERQRAEEALRRYELLASNSRDIILFMEREDGRILEANAAAIEAYGYSREELLTLTIQDLRAADTRSLAAAQMTQADERGILFETVHQRKDGSDFPVEVSSRGATLNGQRTLISVVRDISERKRADEALRLRNLELETARAEAEEGKRRLEAMMAALPVGVAITDARGGTIMANDAYEQVWRGPRPAAHSVSDYIAYRAWWPETGQALRPEEWASARAVHEGQAVVGQLLEVHRFDGSRGFVLNSASPIRDSAGQVIGSAVAIQDISELRQAEEALRQSEERLRALVNQFAEANARLEDANAALGEADRRKDEFLAMLAHELRNPLAPIRNAVQVLRLAGPAEERLQRHRDIIDRQAAHMARLLDDLLDVSRVTRGKIELQRQALDLAGVLARAVEMAAPLIETRRHELLFSPPREPLSIEGDPERLAQIFGNLLGNAAKYTEEGGRIWLETAMEAGRAVVRVRDTGIGITPEMLPRIFDLFAQADNSRGRERGGLGIGLTMVQKLVEMHGGEVEARSAGAGQGSEFIVRLPAMPVAPEADAPSARTAASPGATRSRRVLVVDDIADSAESLADVLRLWGHETQTAHSGAAALDWARWFRPDVVLLDLGMPGMDGFAVARRLRAQESNHAMLLVAITGYGQQQDREATRATGFDAHLVKPVDMDALGELLTQTARTRMED